MLQGKNYFLEMKAGKAGFLIFFNPSALCFIALPLPAESGYNYV
jgi:hypothetical protein